MNEIEDRFSNEILEEENKVRGIHNDPQYWIKNINLANGGEMEIRLFNRITQLHHYRYHYNQKDANRSKPKLVNRFQIHARYLKGVLHHMVTSMHIIFPERRGKMYLLGVDISEKSTFFFQFFYRCCIEEGQVSYLKLFGIDSGAHFINISKLETESKTHLQQTLEIVFPFPFPEKIEYDFGVYTYPFLTNNDKQEHFNIPHNIKA